VAIFCSTAPVRQGGKRKKKNKKRKKNLHGPLSLSKGIPGNGVEKKTLLGEGKGEGLFLRAPGTPFLSLLESPWGGE